MRIFSNFNTQYALEVYEDCSKSYKAEEILLLRRSKYYLFFHITPFFFLYLLLLFVAISVLMSFSVNFIVYIVFFLMWLLIFWFQIVYKYLKYICDFTIVTPAWINTYKQKGILHSVFKEIPAGKIKAVEVFRSSLLWNIFRYGSVDIIADMNDTSYIDVDNEAPWIVGLSYVDSPHKVKSKISKICYR